MANPPTGTAGPIHLNTDTVWMEVEMNLLGQWAEPRAIWLVISHDPWLLGYFKGFNPMA